MIQLFMIKSKKSIYFPIFHNDVWISFQIVAQHILSFRIAFANNDFWISFQTVAQHILSLILNRLWKVGVILRKDNRRKVKILKRQVKVVSFSLIVKIFLTLKAKQGGWYTD